MRGSKDPCHFLILFFFFLKDQHRFTRLVVLVTRKEQVKQVKQVKQAKQAKQAKQNIDLLFSPIAVRESS